MHLPVNFEFARQIIGFMRKVTTRSRGICGYSTYFNLSIIQFFKYIFLDRRTCFAYTHTWSRVRFCSLGVSEGEEGVVSCLDCLRAQEQKGGIEQVREWEMTG